MQTDSNPKTGMTLKVLNPLGISFEKQISSIRLPTSSGSFGILHNHTPLLSALSPGIISFTPLNSKSGEREIISITGGFVEVVNNLISVLTDELFFRDDIPAEFHKKHEQLASFQVKKDEFGTKEQNLARFHLLFLGK